MVNAVFRFLCIYSTCRKSPTDIPFSSFEVQAGVNDELIFHIRIEEPPVVDLIYQIQVRENNKLILVTDPIQRLMTHDLLRMRGNERQQEEGDKCRKSAAEKRAGYEQLMGNALCIRQAFRQSLIVNRVCFSAQRRLFILCVIYPASRYTLVITVI